MNISNDDFIQKVGKAMCDLYPTYKILPSLGLAQAIKESGWGKHDCNNSYNFFGMKAGKNDKNYIELKTKEYVNGKYVEGVAKFLKFNSFQEGMEAYCKFIHKYKRYSNLIGELDAETACKNVASDGWATAPNYGTSLYNDYVVKYRLKDYDDIALAGMSPVVPENLDLIHTVKKGESLWSISYKYLGFGTKWKTIYNYNNLTSTNIIPGQQLKIPR